VIATTSSLVTSASVRTGLLDPEGLLKGFGGWALLVACIILFVECGLLVGVILPGDSLLFIVGMLLASNFITTPLALAIALMTLSAIAGNLMGYWTGAKVGPRLFNKPNSKIFKQEHVVTTQNFFEKHGSRAIVMARFVPVVRSVITGMAGVAKMDYKTYATFSTIGGIAWVVSMTLAGYFLGSISFVKDNIELVAIGIVFLSAIPIALEVLRQRKNSN
jgi:membrane-associated protein